MHARVRRRLARRSLARFDPGAREARLVDATPGLATTALYGRLDPADVEATEARLSSDDARLWRLASEPGIDPAIWRMLAGVPGREALTLALALHYGVEGVEEKTRLRAVMPPEGVHAMTAGSWATGGSYYYADLLGEALAAAGSLVPENGAALDFGCSSGRLARVCAAVWPGVRWHGCDPNEGAIAWAAEHLGDLAEFNVSPSAPPLPYADGEFDLVVAVSIWSHFGDLYALRWLQEMHRILRPGGHLILTTHGWDSIAHFHFFSLRPPSLLARVGVGLYERGFFFHDEFGKEGDLGLRDEQWGLTFFTLEWLLPRVADAWGLAWYSPGRAQGNQDVLVFQRR